MRSASFDESLPFVLRWEGGYVDHPADPGGATNKGITQAVYDRWREREGLPRQGVRAVADAEVAAIYEGDYWQPPRCGLLRRRLDLVQFDTAVNMGPGRAVRFLQQVLGLPVDGVFGPRTEQAVRDAGAGEEATLADVLARYCTERERFYLRLVERNPRLAVFRRGWLNRLNALRAEVGLPGFESAGPLDFGDTGRVQRIPDFGIDPAWEP